MSGKASGVDPGGSSANGDTKHRTHHDGSSSRAFTVEQKTAVIRVRKCSPTAFYDILGLEEVKTTCSEGDIKKAYRKLSLLTHPDKNGYEGADEAFKMVSRAFSILSDPEKKTKFDKFGGDPDNRFSGGASASSPFSGFARRSYGGAGPGASMFEEEISPEEMFRQFFGGGFPFDTGSQFVFNVNGFGGPGGIRVTQFGGGRPRRRPHGHGEQAGGPEQQPSLIMSLLPIILLFLFPLLSQIFGSSGPSGPTFDLHGARGRHTLSRQTPGLKVKYWVDPRAVEDLSKRGLRDLDQRVEETHVGNLQRACYQEKEVQQDMELRARGWIYTDEVLLDKARRMKLDNCKALDAILKQRR